MDISPYILEYAGQKHFYNLSCDADTVRGLLTGRNTYALINQECYGDSDCLAANIRQSVTSYTRDKATAIAIYKDLLKFLRGKKLGIDLDVDFPPENVSNRFERLMFIAKYLQDPNNRKQDLYNEDDPERRGGLLCVSEKTIRNDINALRGRGACRIQVCGRVFQCDDVGAVQDDAHQCSMAHPLFLAPNLTQAVIMLKGLKEMYQNPLYAEWAEMTAADIWDQLSAYAKRRIRFVFEDVFPEELEWFDNLHMLGNNSFYSEFSCKSTEGILLNCIKHDIPCNVEYQDESAVRIYHQCKIAKESFFKYDGTIEVDTDKGRVRLDLQKIKRVSSSPEGLL